MEYRNLGNTDIKVSAICLGTMTWGQQNTMADAFEQLDYACSQGINFIDTAEMYSIPPTPETYGATESIIGKWFAKQGNRNEIILASKIIGPAGQWMPYIRDGNSRFNKSHIEQAINGSLKRLKTDYIDLYQLHWPERKTNFFGQLGFTVQQEEDNTPIEETLSVLQDQIQAGKIRYIGLSNETPWGVMKFIEIAEKLSLPRVVSIQNPYSLLNRSYEVGLAEVSYREKCGLLAYSPLGFGVLSGKYLKNNKPEGARLTLFPEYARYMKPAAITPTEQYVSLANDYDLKPAQLALSFINSQPFVTSNIIGATTVQQLRENIDSIHVNLSQDVIDEIERIHATYPNPCP